MTRDPIHPGETLREDLEALWMSAAELARRIDTEILNDCRAVTGDTTALRLGRFFETSGKFWLNLQKLYELRLGERRGRDDYPVRAAGDHRRASARAVAGSGTQPQPGASGAVRI